MEKHEFDPHGNGAGPGPGGKRFGCCVRHFEVPTDFTFDHQYVEVPVEERLVDPAVFNAMMPHRNWGRLL